jgi:hypothetical protein
MNIWKANKLYLVVKVYYISQTQKSSQYQLNYAINFYAIIFIKYGLDIFLINFVYLHCTNNNKSRSDFERLIHADIY